MSARKLIEHYAAQAGINLNHDVEIHDERFYERVLVYGNMGLGESYVEGWWEPQDKKIDDMIDALCRANLHNIIRSATWRAKIWLLLVWVWTWIKTTLAVLVPSWGIHISRVVATDHYDIGNEVYSRMLDSTLTYSCAYFPKPNMSLTQGQDAKMELIARKLQLKPGMRVLDIGCGWGGLISYLVKYYRVKAEGLTISLEQYKHCQDKKLTVHLADYRQFVPLEEYDAIVSVGMMEHVTAPHYRDLMERVHTWLKPQGYFLLHTIGGNISRLAGDRWLNTYIFPHSHLPSLAQMSAASEGLFVTEHVENFGPHYDTTLIWWYKNFHKNLDKINRVRQKEGKQPLNNRFIRIWDYYLLMCAGSFRARSSQLYQVVYSKGSMPHYPLPSNAW